MRLCAILAIDGHCNRVVIDVDPLVFNVLVDRQTQIAVGEMLAVLALFREFGKLLQGCSLVVFIDNIGVICSIVSGSSKFADLGSMAHAAEMFLVRKCIVPWFEHVASWSNVADGGSRVGITDEVARACGVQMRMGALPPLPAGFPRSAVDDWQCWFD